MSPMLTIARREYRSYFDSPLAYVVICLSFLALGLCFFFLLDGGFWQRNLASLAKLFDYAPYGLCILVIPVVTMRLLAEERRSGTLELLITLPVKDSDVILGKYLGALGLVLTLIAATLIYPVAMFKGIPWTLGPLDLGPVLSAYLGLALLSAAAVAIGLLVSALTESQAIAFFVTCIALAFFLLIGYLAEPVGGWIGNTLSYVSFQERLTGFTRGLIDTRDVVFFLSVTMLALVVAFRALERRKWA